MIRRGATVGKFACARQPKTDLEYRIYGEEVPLAPQFMCERCFGLYLSATEAGYCYEMVKGEDIADEIRYATSSY